MHDEMFDPQVFETLQAFYRIEYQVAKPNREFHLVFNLSKV